MRDATQASQIFRAARFERLATMWAEQRVRLGCTTAPFADRHHEAPYDVGRHNRKKKRVNRCLWGQTSKKGQPGRFPTQKSWSSSLRSVPVPGPACACN